MSVSYKILKSNSDFFAAALTQSRVAIIETRGDLAGLIVDYCGPIQKWTPESLKIQDTYYRRGEYEFRVID